MRLSLCIITKNEEMNLSKCLESVKDIVDEMIIVDTGSADNTVKIAESYGAKVFYYSWNDNFSEAKNFAFKQAKGDWILTMDADEALNVLDLDKVLPLLDNPEIDIYLFQTLSYVGNKPGLETVSNLNIRIIRNHNGYRYTGAIHEQICNENQEWIEKSKVKIEKIIIYHTGYLDTMAAEKDKPSRNMKILEKLLEEYPKDNFHLFNMGNEYLRLKEYTKALEYYQKAYESFMPQLAHSPKLLLKMVMTLDTLEMYDKEMKLLNTGLGYYPKFIDLEYLRACLYHREKKYSLAIRGFKKCLTIEESPLQLCNINDVNGYRAYYALGEIHSQIGDYEEAYNYYIETIKSKPNFYLPLYRIAENLMKRGRDIHATKVTLERFFGENLNAGAYAKLGDIFFSMKFYDVALEYFLKVHGLIKTNQSIYYNVATSLFYLKNYQEAYQWFEKVTDRDYYGEALYKMILCEVILDNIENAERLLHKDVISKDTHTRIVYEAFINLAANRTCGIISDDKEQSKEYIRIIFTLLNNLIKTATPEMFEKSLQLTNLVENDEVLLRLAKLYYYHGYYRLAFLEFIRSIKMFDRIDKEGLEMMGTIMDSPNSSII